MRMAVEAWFFIFRIWLGTLNFLSFSISNKHISRRQKDLSFFKWNLGSLISGSHKFLLRFFHYAQVWRIFLCKFQNPADSIFRCNDFLEPSILCSCQPTGAKMKKNFFNKWPFRGNFMRKIDCAHRKILKIFSGGSKNGKNCVKIRDYKF